MSTKNLRKRQSALIDNRKSKGSKEEVKHQNLNKFAEASHELQYATSSLTHRLWTRTVVVISVIIIIYFYASKSHESMFALVRENVPLRVQKFKCSEQYEKEIEQFPQCVPNKCGRFVADKLIDVKEVEILLDMAQSIINLAGSSGGASILDIHTGALSYGDKYINFYKMPKAKHLIKPNQLTVYNMIQDKIKLAIAEQFGINPSNLYLTSPTFFSRLTNITGKNVHDEYWHDHVDKETYPSFHYTSLLYLNNFNKDFKGGRFIFIDNVEKNRTSAIEPKMGRVSAFTSGHENRHYVEKVKEGLRFAVTISFTCDPSKRINDREMVIPKE